MAGSFAPGRLQSGRTGALGQLEGSMQIDETTAYSAFGSDVFTDAEMERRLPAEMYRALHRTMEEGTELTFEVAGAVATAMMHWAAPRILRTGSSR